MSLRPSSAPEFAPTGDNFGDRSDLYSATRSAVANICRPMGCKPILVQSSPVETRSTTPHSQMAVGSRPERCASQRVLGMDRRDSAGSRKASSRQRARQRTATRRTGAAVWRTSVPSISVSAAAGVPERPLEHGGFSGRYRSLGSCRGPRGASPARAVADVGATGGSRSERRR